MPPTTTSRRGLSLSRRSLGAQLLLLSGALVLGTVLLAVGLTALRAQQVAQQVVRGALDKARAAQRRVIDQRLTELRLIARFLGGDPHFVAYVAEADPTSIRDLLQERQQELGVDFAAVLDRVGRVVARTDQAAAAGQDMSTLPFVAEAVKRGEASGVWGEGGHYWTVALQLLVSGGEIPMGLVVAGLSVDDDLAIEVRRQSGAEVAYVTGDAQPTLIATTLPDARDLLRAIARQKGGPLPRELTLAGRRWAVETTMLGRAESVAGGASPAVIAVTLASIDEALAPFRHIETSLALGGLAALLAAFALSWLASHRIARPLERLADAAEAARRGQFDAELPAGGAAEVGRLAHALTALLGELREEREVQGYLRSLTQSLPEPTVPTGDTAGLVRRGTVLGGRFEVIRAIGVGGMGVVYQARDRQLRDVVALKMLPKEKTQPAALDDLKNELRLARRITHPNVLRTHDFGEAGGLPFISMEFVRGVTWRTLCAHGERLPVAVCLRLARQLAAGLEAAHGLGVVHRDIKPENLMVDSTGHLKIMDFGIARATRLAIAGAAQDATPAGTLGYLSPEQLAGNPGDARSDLYAVGVVLYEALSGRRPFTAADPNELAYRVMNEDAPSLRTVAPEVPEALAELVMRCLAREPSRRWQSAAELEAALEQVRP